MTRVTMTHPSLPADQRIEVDEVSVPHHQAAGWQIVEDQPHTTSQTKTMKAAARRRRQSPKGDES
ncbi:hypothetical protein [Streptomyces sp. NPDC002845]